MISNYSSLRGFGMREQRYTYCRADRFEDVASCEHEPIYIPLSELSLNDIALMRGVNRRICVDAYAREWTGREMIERLMKLPSIYGLYLSLDGETGPGVVESALRIQGLTRLSVQCVGDTAGRELALIHHATSLEEFYLDNSVELSEDVFVSLASLPRIRHVAMEHNLTLAAATHFARSRTLRELWLRVWETPHFDPLLHAPALETLTLSGGTNTVLKAPLDTLRSPRRMSLNGIGLRNLEAVHGGEGLEALELRPECDVNEETFRHLSRVASLRDVTIVKSTKDVLERAMPLFDSQSIRHLSLQGMLTFTEKLARAFVGMQALESLFVGAHAIEDGALKELGSAQHLAYFCMGDAAELSNADAEGLLRSNSLRILNLHNMRRLSREVFERIDQRDGLLWRPPERGWNLSRALRMEHVRRWLPNGMDPSMFDVPDDRA